MIKKLIPKIKNQLTIMNNDSNFVKVSVCFIEIHIKIFNNSQFRDSNIINPQIK